MWSISSEIGITCSIAYTIDINVIKKLTNYIYICIILFNNNKFYDILTKTLKAFAAADNHRMSVCWRSPPFLPIHTSFLKQSKQVYIYMFLHLLKRPLNVCNVFLFPMSLVLISLLINLRGRYVFPQCVDS